MVLPWVEEEQILSHLVEDESLADVSPVLLIDRGEEVEEDHDGNAGENGDAGKQDATKQY